jgi:murein DD-endopeptidase MepM/ murein hydrolase activator NlpD
MRRASIALGLVIATTLTLATPPALGAEPPPTSGLAASAAASTSSPPGDEIDPIPPAKQAEVEARAKAYTDQVKAAQPGGQSSTNGTGSSLNAQAVGTPDGVPFVGRGTVWCTYSNPGSPGNYCSGYHPYPALDIGMAPGTVVVAAGDGQVVDVSTGCVPGNTSCGGQAGNYVSIAHADGRYSRYMHLTSLTVAVGQNVVKGQQIGFSGWTGNVQPDDVSAAHLHYEEDAQRYGTPVDPGEMYLCINRQVAGVLAAVHATNWQQVPWGTVIANDSTCTGQTTTPPPPPPGPPPWSSVFAFGGSAASRVAAGTNADGRQEIFVVGPYGFVFHSWQVSPNGFWSDWNILDVSAHFPASSTPTIATNADGRLEVFLLGSDQAMWHGYQVSPNSGWASFSSMGGSSAANPSVARNADGRLELFALNTNGTMWHQWQQAPNTGWAGWYALGGVWPANTMLATPANRDGRLELFAVGTDAQIWHAWQGVPSGSFSSFMAIGGSLLMGQPLSATTNLDGRLDVFATGGGMLWHINQVSAGGGWNTIAAISSGWASQPAALLDRSGRIDVVAMGTNGQLGVEVQDAANGSWRPPVFVGGSGSSRPSLNPNADGHVEAYFTGTDSGIYHAWQMVAP